MQTRTLIAVVLSAAIGSCAIAGSGRELTIDQAHHAYYQGQFRRSLLMYEQLAAQGNAEAAERAGFMLVQGDGLYGWQVRRDLERATVLLTRAAKAGRPGAGFMLNMMERTD